MVDLIGQYHQIKSEIDEAIQEVLESARFIKGPQVTEFEESLSHYLDADHVITCANGTDALQIALMALDLKPGDEVIVPAFTYVATAEVIALLKLTPVMVDVDPRTFTVMAKDIEKEITPATKAIVPVHLFGQSADMEDILDLAGKHNVYIIEDNAQAIGAQYTFKDEKTKSTGTMGHIGCVSFFPSKNLGCFGDGGALMTGDKNLADKIRMIANHGQVKKYHHDIVGCNSRLDTLQAAILSVKLKYLDRYNEARQWVAGAYDKAFRSIDGIKIPHRLNRSTHVFHQYTLIVENGKRDDLQKYLTDAGIPSMIYYPIPLYRQKAFEHYYKGSPLPVTEKLCASVLSLPIHTEMDQNTLDYIIERVSSFFQ